MNQIDTAIISIKKLLSISPIFLKLLIIDLNLVFLFYKTAFEKAEKRDCQKINAILIGKMTMVKNATNLLSLKLFCPDVLSRGKSIFLCELSLTQETC